MVLFPLALELELEFLKLVDTHSIVEAAHIIIYIVGSYKILR